MKGLILKDLYCLKNQMKNLLVIVLCFLLLGITSQKNYGMVSLIIPFYLVLLIITTFSYDDYNHFNTYCNTLPLARKQIIKAKYILVMLSLLCSAILGCLLSLGLYTLDNTVILQESISTVLGSVIAGGIVLAITLPLLYKYGVQKGRGALFAVIIGISLIGSAIGQLLKVAHIDLSQILNQLSQMNMVLGGILLLCIFLVILYISYQASYHIYNKKEF